jgi:hypothetical protein
MVLLMLKTCVQVLSSFCCCWCELVEVGKVTLLLLWLLWLLQRCFEVGEEAGMYVLSSSSWSCRLHPCWLGCTKIRPSEIVTSYSNQAGTL